MGDLRGAIRNLEERLQIWLPATFKRLYAAFDYPFIRPCEFISLDEMLDDSERWRGMLPQFVPFGHDGEENIFGLYAPGTPLGPEYSEYAVLLWDHEYDHYLPIACSFESFLRWCVLYGRYVAQDSFEQSSPECEEEEAQRREFATLVGMPADLVTGMLPRNDRELHERILKADSQNAYALSQIGAAFLGHGEVERARDCFVRASEATPWFGDPYYLLGESYRIANGHQRACELWMQVLTVPIALSTRTSCYDMGVDQSDAEIYEAAADRCIEFQSYLATDQRSQPVLDLIKESDPYAPSARLALADEMAAAGDRGGVERELLNALTLATDGRDIDESYSRLATFYEDAGRMREAELCRGDALRAEGA